MKTNEWVQQIIAFHRTWFPMKEPVLLQFSRYNLYDKQIDGGITFTNIYDFIKGIRNSVNLSSPLSSNEIIRTFPNFMAQKMQPREIMNEWAVFLDTAENDLATTPLLQECILFFFENQARKGDDPKNTIVLKYMTANPCLTASYDIIYKALPSCVDFLTIQYQILSSSSQEESLVPLYVPRDYFMVGNELFRPSFVLFLLDKQDKKHLFHKQYELKLIDNKIKLFSLSYRQSILLLQDHYEIIDCGMKRSNVYGRRSEA
jgi:hypothetical protein